MEENIPKNNISVCLITLNEENDLEDCLLSVKDIAGEIVIADSGSTDRTREIGENFSARIVDLEWRNDFSYARNFAIEHASLDWIFVIDPDEKLHPDDVDALRELTKTDREKIYFLRIEDAYTGASHTSARMWKRGSRIAYEGPIHEQPEIEPGFENKITAEFTQIRLTHFGYRPSSIADKHARNFKMIRELYDQNESDPVTAPKYAYYLAKEYDAGDRLEEAVKYYEISIDGPDFNLLPAALRNLIDLYERKGTFDKAASLAAEGVKVFPEFTDIRYLLGLLYLRKGDLIKARNELEVCLELGEAGGVFHHIKGTGSFLAYRGLGFCALGMGNESEALRLFDEAFRLDPEDKVSETRIRHILESHYNKSQAEIVDHLRSIHVK